MSKSSALIDQAAAEGLVLFSSATPLPADGSAPEWITLFPKVGRVETRDGRAFEVSAETLMAAFKSDGIDIPVDVNHATDAAAFFGGEAPAVGWGTEMRVQDGALQIKVDWLDEGRALLAAKKYRYTSPSFYQDKNVATLLKAVALVTSPALGRQPALAHAGGRAKPPSQEPSMKSIATALGLAEGADEAACLSALNGRVEIKGIAEALGLPATATPAECLSAIGTLRSGQDGVVQQLQTQLSTASTRLAAVEKAARDKEVSELLDGAARERKIVPAQKGELEKLCATDDGLAHVKALLAATAPGLQPSGLDGRAPASGGAPDPTLLAAKATKLQREREEAGQPIGYAEAVVLAAEQK